MKIEAEHKTYNIDRTATPEEQSQWKNDLVLILVGTLYFIGLYDEEAPGTEAFLYGALRFLHQDMMQMDPQTGAVQLRPIHMVCPMVYGRPVPRMQLNDVHGLIYVRDLIEEIRDSAGNPAAQIRTLIENDYLAIIDPPRVHAAKGPLLVR